MSLVEVSTIHTENDEEIGVSMKIIPLDSETIRKIVLNEEGGVKNLIRETNSSLISRPDSESENKIRKMSSKIDNSQKNDMNRNVSNFVTETIIKVVKDKEIDKLSSSMQNMNDSIKVLNIVDESIVNNLSPTDNENGKFKIMNIIHPPSETASVQQKMNIVTESYEKKVLNCEIKDKSNIIPKQNTINDESLGNMENKNSLKVADIISDSVEKDVLNIDQEQKLILLSDNNKNGIDEQSPKVEEKNVVRKIPSIVDDCISSGGCNLNSEKDRESLQNVNTQNKNVVKKIFNAENNTNVKEEISSVTEKAMKIDVKDQNTDVTRSNESIINEVQNCTESQNFEDGKTSNAERKLMSETCSISDIIQPEPDIISISSTGKINEIDRDALTKSKDGSEEASPKDNLQHSIAAIIAPKMNEESITKNDIVGHTLNKNGMGNLVAEDGRDTADTEDDIFYINDRELCNGDKTQLTIEMKPNEDIMRKIKKAMTELFIETTNNNSVLDSCTIKNIAFTTFMNLYGKELEIQEQKYQRQVDDLTLKLAEKQQEVVDLVEEMQEVKDSTERNSDKEQLEIKVEEMKRLIREKEAVAESVRVDLRYTKNEAELSITKMKRLEESLGKAQESVTSLQERNLSLTNEVTRSQKLDENLIQLKEELKKTETIKNNLEKTLFDIDTERDEEMKIVQDALEEAAQEREDLLKTFESELKSLNTTNGSREQQMLEDFEWKLRETEKDHKKKVEEIEKQAAEKLKTARAVIESELSESISKVAEDRRIADETFAQNMMQKSKEQDENDAARKINKIKCDLNAQWENKLRSECARLKGELDELHAEDKRQVIDMLKAQKDQEFQTFHKSTENRHQESNDEISRLKGSLKDKDVHYQNEIENQRTSTDRIIWDLRMKLQKLTESTFDLKQQLEEKHKEQMERLRIDQQERFSELEVRLKQYDDASGIDIVGQLEKRHKIQMEHLGEQHQLTMERFREELECEKFQAVEEARVIITKHHEYIETSLKEKVAELQLNFNQSADNAESIRQSLLKKDEVIKNLEDELERTRDYCSLGSSNVAAPSSSTSSGFSSQFSLTSSSDSQGSTNSQDRYNNSEGIFENLDDPQKAGNGGLLGKVFGGGWFTPSKSNRRGSTPISNKRTYSNS